MNGKAGLLNPFFLRSVKSTSPLPDQKIPGTGNQNLYRELIYHRFNEVLGTVCPRSLSYLGKKKAKTLIHNFIEHGCRSPLINKVPEQFHQYLSKQDPLSENLNRDYLLELLNYEVVEVQLLTGDYTGIPQKTRANIDHSLHYAISPSARLLQLNYPLHISEKADAKNPTKNNQKIELLVYYNFSEKQVFFEEITIIMKEVLETMGSYSLSGSIEHISTRHRIPLPDAEVILIAKIEELYHKKIVVPAPHS